MQQPSGIADCHGVHQASQDDRFSGLARSAEIGQVDTGKVFVAQDAVKHGVIALGVFFAYVLEPTGEWPRIDAQRDAVACGAERFVDVGYVRCEPVTRMGLVAVFMNEEYAFYAVCRARKESSSCS